MTHNLRRKWRRATSYARRDRTDPVPGAIADVFGALLFKQWERRPYCMQLRELQSQWKGSAVELRLAIRLKIYWVTSGGSFVCGLASWVWDKASHYIWRALFKLMS
jgi:hypothetical protein